MEMLDPALDDLVGLIEAYRACNDDRRRSRLRVNHDRLKAIQRELAVAADGYAAVIMASARGEVTPERIERARSEAQAAMEGAWRRRQDLARLVEERRLPLELVRDDLRELIGLSLQCRAGVSAFDASPHFDAAAAEPLANKVLVELRAATLTYLARVRDAVAADADDPTFAQGARKAAGDMLDKAVAHGAEVAQLEQTGSQRSGMVHDVLANGMVAPMRRMARDWSDVDSA